ncbi:hypothetical protein BJP34_32350 [Moorena producens PAL-8-15-08-1]|uniref:Uncharacterized protein n=1 Tax=Moorena producens PAL-8-15-08-1 TaxID=1458985 RepID=A0A1D8U0Q6_9CYAN|nr:hypothetical protein BJP34_32350 [Moorena producens PAL-8-15-08-1]
MNRSGVGILAAGKMKQARCLFYGWDSGKMPVLPLRKQARCLFYGWDTGKMPVLRLGYWQDASSTVGILARCQFYGWDSGKMPVLPLPPDSKRISEKLFYTEFCPPSPPTLGGTRVYLLLQVPQNWGI